MRLTRSLSTVAIAALMALSPQAQAQSGGPGNSGAYLAARHASTENAFDRAVQYYRQALQRDSGNLALMEALITAQVDSGQVDEAFPVVDRLLSALDEGQQSQVANLVRLVQQAEEGSFQAILDRLDQGPAVGELVDGILVAWAELGAGNADAALSEFDALAENEALRSFALYHKALALASVGDFEAAQAIMSGREGGALQMSERRILAQVQILAQLDRREDAIALIDDVTPGTLPPLFADLKRRLESGAPVPFDVAATPAAGVGELMYGVSSALAGDTALSYALIYARLGNYLQPENVEALLLSAQLLEEMGQYDMATATYDKVPGDHPKFIRAEIGRAEALLSDGREDAAVEALRQLARAQSDTLIAQQALGDMLRRLERFDAAEAAYGDAIALLGEPGEADWPLFFSRGITRERTDNWSGAEADLRRALELNPGQPEVLNYLGYTMVEERENLDEALDMINRAVEARPDDGYITDSLGWVRYRLGKFQEAVAPMEQAVSLEPVDPIINDHLGDVYWAVGRTTEARFQWSRALSFDPEPERAERIRRKLEVGLDQVLADEGEEPLDIARENATQN